MTGVWRAFWHGVYVGLTGDQTRLREMRTEQKAKKARA